MLTRLIEMLALPVTFWTLAAWFGTLRMLDGTLAVEAAGPFVGCHATGDGDGRIRCIRGALECCSLHVLAIGSVAFLMVSLRFLQSPKPPKIVLCF